MPAGGFPNWNNPSGTRGNLTSKHEWSSSSVQVTTNYTYDIAGQLGSIQDPNGNLTSYLYDPATDTFLASVTRPKTGSIAHTETYGVDPNTGLRTSLTDENQVLTQYDYNDPLLRLTRVKKAVGTQAETWDVL